MIIKNYFLILLSLIFSVSLLPIKHTKADVAALNNTANFNSLLNEVNAKISAHQARVNSRSKEWLIREKLISGLFEKALMTNDVIDYQNVENELNATIELAPKGSGPQLQAAKFNYSIHRLDKAQSYLDQMKQRVAFKSMDAISMLSIESDIAFQKGEYEKALEGYRLCETLTPGVCSKQLIIFYAKTGGYTEAEALLKNTLSQTKETEYQTRAWLNLQLAILFMERGKYQQALEFATSADKILPDWWLVREHIAEIHTLMKNDHLAEPIYLDVINKTNLPQYMDALAAVYKRAGKDNEASQLIKKAEGLWEAQLKIFPESASGHALEHYFEFNTDTKKILLLAENNYKTRPNSEAKVYLAKAYVLNNELKKAQEIIDSAVNSAYKSADMFDTAREIYSKLGDSVKSENFKMLCMRINPDYYN